MPGILTAFTVPPQLCMATSEGVPALFASRPRRLHGGDSQQRIRHSWLRRSLAQVQRRFVGSDPDRTTDMAQRAPIRRRNRGSAGRRNDLAGVAGVGRRPRPLEHPPRPGHRDPGARRGHTGVRGRQGRPGRRGTRTPRGEQEPLQDPAGGQRPRTPVGDGHRVQGRDGPAAAEAPRSRGPGRPVRRAHAEAGRQARGHRHLGALLHGPEHRRHSPGHRGRRGPPRGGRHRSPAGSRPRQGPSAAVGVG